MSLEDQVRLALLCSERVLGAVLEALANHPAAEPDLRRQAWDTVAAPNAHAFRHNDIEATLRRHFKPVGPGEMAGVYRLDVLRELAEQHLFFDGDRLTVRPERLLDYVELIARVEPAFLIGSLLAERLALGEVSPVSLDGLLDLQCPLALPRHPAGVVYADNHVHLGGVSSTGDALLAIATSNSNKLNPKKWQLPNRFRLTFASRFDQPAVVLVATYRKLFSAILTHILGAPTEEPSGDARPWQALAADLRALLGHGLVLDGIEPRGLSATSRSVSALPLAATPSGCWRWPPGRPRPATAAPPSSWSRHCFASCTTRRRTTCPAIRAPFASPSSASSSLLTPYAA